MIEIYGLIFCCILGSVGHFLYKLTKRNEIIGFLFAQNESTWEHLKLGITPIIIWSIIQLFISPSLNILINTSIKILFFSVVLIILYYIYKHLIKKNILILDIFIFYLSLSISYLISAKMYYTEYPIILNIVSILFYVGLFLAYKNFSKNPPNNFLFKN